jgi:hypothetical protein
MDSAPQLAPEEAQPEASSNPAEIATDLPAAEAEAEAEQALAQGLISRGTAAAAARVLQEALQQSTASEQRRRLLQDMPPSLPVAADAPAVPAAGAVEGASPHSQLLVNPAQLASALASVGESIDDFVVSMGLDFADAQPRARPADQGMVAAMETGTITDEGEANLIDEGETSHGL